MVNKILPILLLSVACAFAAPTPKDGTVKATLKRPANPVQLKDVHNRDVRRWANLATGSSSSIPAINADVSYLITVGLGTPAQDVDLIFDTGSSDLWVQTANYNPKSSSTSKNLDETWTIEYGSGDASGKEYTDIATIGSYTFTQEFGIASTAEGFTGVDGLVGFGPDDLSVITNKGENIPTPVDNLYSSGQIGSDVIGVYFQPITDGGSQETNGEITFGGVDSTKYTGDITYVPITTASPANEYWGIDVSSVKYGSTSVTSTIHGIVDTGTTLILLSSTAVSALYKNISGAKLDNNSGLYTIPASEVSKLEDITFTIGGTAFTLTPSQYLIPANQVANLGGTSGDTYSWIGSLGDNESGLAFILGQKFLENFYSVFDTTNSRVGLAVAA
ncbi:hypothetical protein EMPS_04772 [Entomortierella parvispora]|uniref:Peptidase A1 domain-containing protein n=1 Tax=Entomortierella parvispora TaxID=205924 RepID=A0A9P3LW42_9FUNG|nr:hypothetical protein EMPS_04772 [Entomortierella parvispora]